MRVVVGDAEATRRLGRRLGERLRAGHVVALSGDLGAGKTTLCQGIGAALGAREVQSPTFILAREHEEGRVPLVHVDLYRVEDAAALEQLDLDARLGHDAVVLIEWADRFPELLPADHLHVALSDHPAGRVVELTAAGPHHARVLEALGDPAD